VRLRRIFDDEQGITLVELMVGSVLALLTMAIVATWVWTTSRVEINQEHDLDALAAMRLAKSQVQRELRYADGILPSTSKRAIDVWVDLDNSGGGAPSSSAEHVTWQLTGDTLIRYEGGNPKTAKVILNDVDVGRSTLALNGAVADIEFVVDVEQGSNLVTRTIKTRVTLRNA
jgi:Tfp pilus assembly protein PilW